MENRDQFTILETKGKCDSSSSPVQCDSLTSASSCSTESCCAPEQKVSFGSDPKESTSFMGSSQREMISTPASQNFESSSQSESGLTPSSQGGIGLTPSSQENMSPAPQSQADRGVAPRSEGEIGFTPSSDEKYQTFSPTDYLKDKGPVGERPAFPSSKSDSPTPSTSAYEDVKAGFREIETSDRSTSEKFLKKIFDEKPAQPVEAARPSTPPLFKPNEASKPTVTTTPLFSKDAQSMKGERKSIWDTLVKRETPHLAHEATEYDNHSSPKPEKSKDFTASPDEKVKWD